MVDEKKTEETPAETPAPKELTKEDQAKSVITKYMWGNAVVGMLPIPILDIFTVGGVQFAMIKCISKIYGVEFKNDFMKPLIGAFVGAVGYDLVGKGIFMGLAKFIPPYGLIAGVLSFPVISAASTYAVGKVFVQHFEAGGTLLDMEPAKLKAYFAQYYKEGLEVATKLGEKPQDVKDAPAKK